MANIDRERKKYLRSSGNTSGRAGWNGWARLLRCGRDRPGGGFPNARYEPHASCGDCPLTARSRGKKSGRCIPKNRCRTTVAERLVKTRAELPLMGDQIICLSHEHAGPSCEPEGRPLMAIVIHDTETHLRSRETLRRRQPIPLHSLGVVAPDSLTTVIHEGEIKLCCR